METTKIKVLREIDVAIQGEEIDEDDRYATFTICECLKCQWRFIGTCHNGYTDAGTLIPEYCPMCGTKIDIDGVVD